MNAQQAQFVAVLAQEAKRAHPYAVAYNARALIRVARAQERAAVALCNGKLDQDQYAKRTARTRARLAPILAALGIKRVELGGDPRGYAVKLHLRSGMYNTWGGPKCGYGVPTEGR